MANCGCRDTCQCIIKAGSSNVTVGGSGGISDPYSISVAATPATESVTGIMPKVGTYLGPFAPTASAAGSVAYATGSQDPVMIVVPRAMNIDQIGFEVTTAQAVNARAYLYNSDNDGHPYAMVADSGDISASTTGAKVATITAVTLPAGVYWGFLRSNAGTTVRFRAVTQATNADVHGTFLSLATVPTGIAADIGSTYGSPTNPLSAWTYDTAIAGTVRPLIGIRRSA